MEWPKTNILHARKERMRFPQYWEHCHETLPRKMLKAEKTLRMNEETRNIYPRIAHYRDTTMNNAARIEIHLRVYGVKLTRELKKTICDFVYRKRKKCKAKKTGKIETETPICHLGKNKEKIFGNTAGSFVE